MLIWSSSFNGQIVCWEPETREALRSFTLKNTRTLSQIILVRTTLWCVIKDKILIVDIASEDCPVLQKLIVYDQYEMPTLIEYALMVNENEIWVGSITQRGLTVWNTNTYTAEEIKLDYDGANICCMINMMGSVWIGNHNGKVFIMNPDTRKIERSLHAHTDHVKSMCVTREGHVVTGSSSKEGKVCVWNAMYDLDIIDGKRKKRLQGYEMVDKESLPAPDEIYYK